MEKNFLRMILFILFFILIVLLATYFFLNGKGKRAEGSNDSVVMQSPLRSLLNRPEKEEAPPLQAEEPAEEPAMEELPSIEQTEPAPMAAAPKLPEESAVPERFITDRHEVVDGDSFSLISGYYWNDIYLWPDLYIRNDMLSDDPDLIFPEEMVDIYNRLGRGDDYTQVETEEILKAYLKVYKVYKALGPEKNNSVWSLLWCAAKYDKDFLDKYAAWIDPEDLKMARQFVAEEGFLE